MNQKKFEDSGCLIFRSFFFQTCSKICFQLLEKPEPANFTSQILFPTCSHAILQVVAQQNSKLLQIKYKAKKHNCVNKTPNITLGVTLLN